MGGQTRGRDLACTGAVKRWAVALAVVLLGIRQPIFAGISVGVAFAVLLAPVWLGEILARRAGVMLFAFGTVTVVWGLGLTALSKATHVVDRGQVVGTTSLLVQFVAGVGIVLWALRLFGVARVGMLFAFGLVINGLLLHAASTDNPWKTFYVVPVAIAALSVSRGHRSRLADLVVLLALALASGLMDSRSYAASFFIAAVLTAWQQLRRGVGVAGGESFLGHLEIRAAVALATEETIDERLDAGLGQRPHEAVYRLAILEGEHRGDRLDAHLARDLRVVVDIELDQFDGALGGANRLLQDRRQLAARTAPRRPEIHQHRNLARRVDDVAHEVGGRRVLDQIAAGRAGACLAKDGRIHASLRSLSARKPDLEA